MNLIDYPPATAGGTDPIQECFSTFKAKLHELLNLFQNSEVCSGLGQTLTKLIEDRFHVFRLRHRLWFVSLLKRRPARRGSCRCNYTRRYWRSRRRDREVV